MSLDWQLCAGGLKARGKYDYYILVMHTRLYLGRGKNGQYDRLNTFDRGNDDIASAKRLAEAWEREE
jgi:hypothetical protein